MKAIEECAHPDGARIGIEIQGVYDGVLFWQCSDCGKAWHRWTDEDMRQKAEPYMGKRDAV